uniref:Uncharacterized protein n=1 Tax=Siphoviridae sp. ct2vX3 TaxID=2825318 RepID=A0A8S5PYZ2_9CAUD|nr:MAG TPA: hypothetical protein [Siphoviridae sp. ct2vX3]
MGDSVNRPFLPSARARQHFAQRNSVYALKFCATLHLAIL